jgi:hypothetical protein
MKKTLTLILMAGLFMSSISCRHDVDLSSMKAISFASDIQPVLAGNCTLSGCHSNDNDSKFSLLTYNDVISNGEVESGKPHKSDLYKAVTALEGEHAMPPSPRSRLSDDQLTTIYLWIEQGAKNN